MPARLAASASAIVQEAIAVGCEEGLASIGGRALTRRAGISASAVNYHFGHREALVDAVAAALAEEERDWLRARLAMLDETPPHLGSMGGFVAGLLIDCVGRRRGRTLLRLELPPDSDASTEERFWAEAADALAAPGPALVWRTFFEGALGFAVLDADPVPTATWLLRVVQRLDARLGKRPDGLVLHPQTEEASEPDLERPRPESARRIVEATADMLMEGLPISHRAVAARAGVSLASTTGHFATKADILLEAYRALYRRMYEAAVQGGGLGEPFDQEGNFRQTYAASGRLAVIAARDPALRKVALQMRRRRGLGSTASLRERGLPDVDRIDGLIFSLCYSGALTIARQAPAASRAGRFVEVLQQIESALFAAAAD